MCMVVTKDSRPAVGVKPRSEAAKAAKEAKEAKQSAYKLPDEADDGKVFGYIHPSPEELTVPNPAG